MANLKHEVEKANADVVRLSAENDVATHHATEARARAFETTRLASDASRHADDARQAVKKKAEELKVVQGEHARLSGVASQAENQAKAAHELADSHSSGAQQLAMRNDDTQTKVNEAKEAQDKARTELSTFVKDASQ